MDSVSKWLIFIILIAAGGFILFASEAMRRKAIAESNELVDLRMKEANELADKRQREASEHSAKESEKHLAELREIKDLLKKVTWQLEQKQK